MRHLAALTLILLIFLDLGIDTAVAEPGQCGEYDDAVLSSSIPTLIEARVSSMDLVFPHSGQAHDCVCCCQHL